MNINAPTFNPFAGDTRTDGELSLLARVKNWRAQAMNENLPAPPPAPALWYWIMHEEYLLDEDQDYCLLNGSQLVAIR